MYVAKSPGLGGWVFQWGLTFLTLGTRQRRQQLPVTVSRNVGFSGLLRLPVPYLVTLGVSASQPVSASVEDDGRANPGPPYLLGV